MKHITRLEERRLYHEYIKKLTAALYEAKVKDEEIISLLEKYGDMNRKEAATMLRNEKFIEAPCRSLYEYLVVNIFSNEKEADIFIHNVAKIALTNDKELSKLSPAKLYDKIK